MIENVYGRIRSLEIHANKGERYTEDDATRDLSSIDRKVDLLFTDHNQFRARLQRLENQWIKEHSER